MSTNDLFSTETDIDGTADATGQLRLLDSSDLPLQFRLDKATRERGLAHVAEMRRQILRQAGRQAA